jgi:hypothetical protein
MAERIEAGLLDRPPANDTSEPEAQPRAESEPAPATAEAAQVRPVTAGTIEPEPAPLSPNRHERRRLEALARRASGPVRAGA